MTQEPTHQQLVGASVIAELAQRTKCLYCKHRFSEPLILPVEEKNRPSNNGSRPSPNFSPEWLMHVRETHGYPIDIFCGWIVQSIYTPLDDWKLISPVTKQFEPIQDAYDRANAAARDRNKK